MVAGGHVHGRHHLCRRYAAGRHWPCVHPGRCRELAVVGVPAFGHDDGVPLRPSLAPLRPAHGCAVRRDAVLRQACGVPARLPRRLPRPADELPNSRLGDQSDDQHRGDHARRQRS